PDAGDARRGRALFHPHDERRGGGDRRPRLLRRLRQLAHLAETGSDATLPRRGERPCLPLGRVPTARAARRVRMGNLPSACPCFCFERGSEEAQMELLFQAWDELDDWLAALRHVLSRYVAADVHAIAMAAST